MTVIGALEAWIGAREQEGPQNGALDVQAAWRMALLGPSWERERAGRVLRGTAGRNDERQHACDSRAGDVHIYIWWRLPK